jgi:hypothetical protein
MKELVAKMSRFRVIGVALVAVFAFGVVAASAQAVPFWTIGGTRLEAGQTHNVTAKLFSAEATLTTPEAGITISCKSATLGAKTGVLLGSNEGEPGKNNEVAVFKTCTTTGNGEGCEVEEPITTNPLVSELVENVEKKEAGKKLLVEFFPEVAANGFVELKFKGAKCRITPTKVNGSTAAEVLTDPSEGVVELGQTATQATSWLFKFPKVAVKEVWLVTNGTGTVKKKVGLEAFGDESTEEATVLVLLANSSFVSEEKLWSPLP